jgi:hypothetical protein
VDEQPQERGLHVLPRIAADREKKAANVVRVGTARQQRRRRAMEEPIEAYTDSLNLSHDDVLAIQTRFSQERAQVDATFVSKL